MKTLVDQMVQRYYWLETQRYALERSIASHDLAIRELSPTQFAEYARRTTMTPNVQEKLKV